MGIWNETLTTFAMALLNLLLVALTACVPVLVRHVIGWLASQRKIAESDAEEQKRTDRQTAIEEIATRAVMTTAQTFTGDLKAKAADHKLTPEERKEAFARTYAIMHKHLLERGISETSEILEDYIEEAVARLKP